MNVSEEDVPRLKVEDNRDNREHCNIYGGHGTYWYIGVSAILWVVSIA